MITQKKVRRRDCGRQIGVAICPDPPQPTVLPGKSILFDYFILFYLPLLLFLAFLFWIYVFQWFLILFTRQTSLILTPKNHTFLFSPSLSLTPPPPLFPHLQISENLPPSSKKKGVWRHFPQLHVEGGHPPGGLQLRKGAMQGETAPPGGKLCKEKSPPCSFFPPSLSQELFPLETAAPYMHNWNYDRIPLSTFPSIIRS